MNLDNKFLMEQTKPCPHCGVRTKKDGGCMYMQCAQWYDLFAKLLAADSLHAVFCVLAPCSLLVSLPLLLAAGSLDACSLPPVCLVLARRAFAASC